MGKGGQRVSQQVGSTIDPTKSAAAAVANNNAFAGGAAQRQQQKPRSNVWKSPYNPLDPGAPALPTKGEIRAVIPPHCFRRSYFWSFFYLFRDLVMGAVFVYLTSQVLTTDLPSPQTDTPIYILKWLLGWSLYTFWMGTIMTGPWVIAHEAGHGAFSDSMVVNDTVGFIVHQALLVPYFAWQYTHAKHHRRTNHLIDGESHVPSTKEENGLGPHNERLSFYAAWHEVMGDGMFALFQIWTHLGLGWPVYLMGLASTGRLAYDGSPLNGRTADHIRPHSPMFPPKVAAKIWLSTITQVAALLALAYATNQLGFVPVFLWYWCPYFVVNGWLVLYTWLQHTDPSVPHYDDHEWTWVRGALSTIDRSYGIFDFFHHTIGSTHVVHHLFHEMPWYNAVIATPYVRAFLEPKGLYNHDPTPSTRPCGGSHTDAIMWKDRRGSSISSL